MRPALGKAIDEVTVRVGLAVAALALVLWALPARRARRGRRPARRSPRRADSSWGAQRPSPAEYITLTRTKKGPPPPEVLPTTLMVKENLLKFDGRPLFPERIAYTVPYQLSDAEARLDKK